MQFSIGSLDWSGTISDDRQPVYAANMRLLGHYGKNEESRMGFEEWRRRSRLTVVDFLTAHGIVADASEMNSLYKQFFNEEAKGKGPVVYPNAAEALEHLQKKGITLVVLSSHPQQNLEREADEYGLRKYFEEMVGDCQNKTAGLKKIAYARGKTPRNIMHFGDTIFDIQVAKAAGSLSLLGFLMAITTAKGLWQKNLICF